MKRGIEGALKVARLRGQVTIFRNGPECAFNFMIRTLAGNFFIRLRYITMLHKPVGTIEAENRDLLALLRSQAGPVRDAAEIWFYNKHGSYRYFRIGESGLTELDCTGAVPTAEDFLPDQGQPGRSPDLNEGS
ncbi:MAG TPA: hypothetical protein P5217_09605 [Methanoregulaceae archaeon]|nr:hypothetical protein [Methanoregulaceae archaeon]HRY76524.1 hypothetical protein [Methanoregulaceae archaeon]